MKKKHIQRIFISIESETLYHETMTKRSSKERGIYDEYIKTETTAYYSLHSRWISAINKKFLTISITRPHWIKHYVYILYINFTMEFRFERKTR